MSKASNEGKPSELDENKAITNSPQAQPEYKETANILTDNRKTDYDQPNLNPNSEAIKRDSTADGLSEEIDLGGKKKAKKPKAFKSAEEAFKYLGKQVLVLHGTSHQVAQLYSVSATGVEAPQHFHYHFNQVAPWEGTKEQKDYEDEHTGNPAWDVNTKKGATEKRTGKSGDELANELSTGTSSSKDTSKGSKK